MARQRYKTADDAISSIQANINKVALLKQNSSSRTDALAASKLQSDLRRTTNADCGTLIDMLGDKYKAQIIALQQGLDGNWVSINHNLDVKRPQYEEQQPSAETQHGTETLLDLAGRIDALNQANLAQEEQEIETQRGKLRHFSVAAICLLLSLEFAIAGERRHGKEVHGSNRFAMVIQKCRPSLRRLGISGSLSHPTQYSSLGNNRCQPFSILPGSAAHPRWGSRPPCGI
jgi:hypothetical protein